MTISEMVAAELDGVTLEGLVGSLHHETDLETLNMAAFQAALYHDRAKRAHADKEAGRTLFRFKVQGRLRDEGRASSDKAAEQLAKEDPEYLAYCAEVEALDESADFSLCVRDALQGKARNLRAGGALAGGF